MRVLIIGAGIGGLCLAHGLKKAGIDVHIFEKQIIGTESLAGYGIHINPLGKQALRRCLPPTNWRRIEDFLTSAGTQLFFWDTALKLLAERDDAQITGKPKHEVERSGIGRIELRDALLDGLDSAIHWNKSFTHFTQHGPDRVRAYFADGTFEEGDILVGADGGHSKVRQQYLPDVKRLNLGILAIAGRYVLNEDRVKGLPAEITNGSLNNIVPRGKGWMFVSTWKSKPAACDDINSNTDHYVVWAYVVSQEDTPQDSNVLSGLQLQQFVLRSMKDWSPKLKTIVQGSDSSTIKAIPLKSMEALTKWTPSNITLLGDAIHNMTPMAGVGANTALRDAEILTHVLTEAASGLTSVVDAVGAYENEMRQYANAAVGMSRRNAESASNDGIFHRWAFRCLLHAAQVSPMIMKATLGRPLTKTS